MSSCYYEYSTGIFKLPPAVVVVNYVNCKFIKYLWIKTVFQVSGHMSN